MTVREQLNAIVEEKNLLNHPFYQAWSEGTLPVDALKTYASEYGNFVALVPQGWRQHGDETIAQEEETHVVLWQAFANNLNTQISTPQVKEVQNLVDVCNKHFHDNPGSMGGLFAFEAQQPHTSTSKLKGLKDHYPVLNEEGQEYFRIHCDDVLEMEILAKRIESLPANEQAQAIAACKEVADALWDGLTGIHNLHCPETVN